MKGDSDSGNDSDSSSENKRPRFNEESLEKRRTRRIWEDQRLYTLLIFIVVCVHCIVYRYTSDINECILIIGYLFVILGRNVCLNTPNIPHMAHR